MLIRVRSYAVERVSYLKVIDTQDINKSYIKDVEAHISKFNETALTFVSEILRMTYDFGTQFVGRISSGSSMQQAPSGISNLSTSPFLFVFTS